MISQVQTTFQWLQQGIANRQRCDDVDAGCNEPTRVSLEDGGSEWSTGVLCDVPRREVGGEAHAILDAVELEIARELGKPCRVLDHDRYRQRTLPSSLRRLAPTAQTLQIDKM